MLENFQLVAIARDAGKPRLYRIPMHRALQTTLATSWATQLDAFTANIDEIAFNAAYSPEEHERFRLRPFELPEWLRGHAIQSVGSLDPISRHDEVIDSIRAIVGLARVNGEDALLFQNFSRSHVIEPGRFLFLQDDTYETTQRPGLALDGKLSALYLPKQQKLLFHNFRAVNTFLPLADVYEEASEQDIRAVLAHERLMAVSVDALAVGANQWFRKRFAMLRDSGVLEKYTASQIKARSKGYEVEIQVRAGKVIFPADRASAKRVLQFLNEELFRGAITERLYETNSKREAD